MERGAEDSRRRPFSRVFLRAGVDASLERKHLRDRERELLARLAPGLPDGAGIGDAASAGRRIDATLLLARLHAVDPLMQAASAQETLDLVGSWSTLMLDAIEGHGG